jgi:predicted nucleotidyltransferase component of viral defense system
MRLEEERKRTQVPWEVIERDYLLSWILQGIYSSEKLASNLIFKGGTALKKCYFGDHYRFSEDLDFSALEGILKKEDLHVELRNICSSIEDLMSEFAAVKLTIERYEEREPHPSGQEAFIIRAQFPWHRAPQTPTYIEITIDEPVLKDPAIKPIFHSYGEVLSAKAKVYCLEEIVSEKLRAILQHTERLKKRGWGRSRARDFYDLWQIKTRFYSQVNWSEVSDILLEKCKIRHVSFHSSEDFFNKIVVDHVRSTWEQWLKPLVSDLKDFDFILEDLRVFIKEVIDDNIDLIT